MTPIVMVVLDGAGDRPGVGETPLERARTPHLDALASEGSLGTAFTVGKGIAPESDAGVFSLLGYDPLKTHLSRGIVEALGAGVNFQDGDLALRAGFASVVDGMLVDRRAGRNLSTGEAEKLGEAVNHEVHLKDSTSFTFKPTVGHRAVAVFHSTGRRLSGEISNFDPAYLRKGMISVALSGNGPYDIPKCEGLDGSEEAVRTAALVNEFGFKAMNALDHHPVNEERRRRGWRPANFVLMRDAGTRMPSVPSFRQKWGRDGVLVADLPAELGIGRLLGMKLDEMRPGSKVEDYHARADLVLRRASQFGFVYVHLKGPDEPAHDGLFEDKVRRIEEIDEGFFSVLVKNSVHGKAVVCVTCDHSTPWREKGHSDYPVPVLIVGPTTRGNGSERFTEKLAERGGLGVFEKGSLILERLVREFP